jgi:hypothetical protein
VFDVTGLMATQALQDDCWISSDQPKLVSTTDPHTAVISRVRVYTFTIRSARASNPEPSRALDVQVTSIPGFLVKKAIPVRLTKSDDDEYVASFSAANVAITGDSGTDALMLFKEHLAAVFRLLRKSKLGPEPKKQLNLLEEYIGEEPTASARS